VPGRSRRAGMTTAGSAAVLLQLAAAHLGHREWLSGVQLAANTGAASAVRCCFRNLVGSGWWVSVADTAAACGVRRYRNRSPGWRPLDGCRHCRYARASCR
jgi:hypothetical protein